jgi:hypothetical protein
LNFKSIFIPFVVMLLSTQVCAHLLPHSLKKLTVNDNDMVLFQLFVENDSYKVISNNDMLGIRQKGKQVSMYIDLKLASVDLQEALSVKDYLRDKEEISILLKKSFSFKLNENQIHIKLIR